MSMRYYLIREEQNTVDNQLEKKEVKPRRNIANFLDVPMKIHVELGRAKLMIKDILELGEGSIVYLDSLVGEDLNIYVNDKLFAKGEVVIVGYDEQFSIRITKILNQKKLEGVQK